MGTKGEATEDVARKRSLGNVLEFLRVIWRMDHALQRVSKRLESSLGITGPQRLVLRIVGRLPGISPGDLARVLHVHPSTLTGVLRRLEDRKLVARVIDPADGRRSQLRLTAAGRRLDIATPGTAESVARRVLARVGDKKAQLALGVLDELIAELEAEVGAEYAD